MSNISAYDELDQAIDQMLQPQLASPSFPQRARNGWGPQNRRDPGAPPETAEENIRELVELAADLRDLPRANFKSRLKLELEWEAAGRTVSATDTDRQAARGVAPASGEILPSLFGKKWAGYPVRRINFALSAALHGVMAFLIGAGFLMVKSYVPRVEPQPNVTVRLEPYLVPLGIASQQWRRKRRSSRQNARERRSGPASGARTTDATDCDALNVAASAGGGSNGDCATGPGGAENAADWRSIVGAHSAIEWPGSWRRNWRQFWRRSWRQSRRPWPRTGNGRGLLRRSLFRGERREHAARDLCSRARVFRGSAHCEVPGRGDAAGDDWHRRPRQKSYRCAVAGHGAGPESAGCGAHMEV